MTDEWRCPHGLNVDDLKATGKAGCSGCVADIESAPDPATMSSEERAEEMHRLKAPLSVPFDLIHKRTEALVGRPVWTHEFAMWDQLVEEARTWQRASMDTVMERMKMLAGDKPVIFVGLEEK